MPCRYDHAAYHEAVTLVSQEPTLTAPTIGTNIAYALEPAPPLAAIEDAARLANCHDFTVEFAEGYDTKTGEKGTQLSGGQKQRVAIARALIRRPKVLLLDEATSALDSTSEATVQAAIDKNIGDRAVIMIAHRLSTVKNATRIVVLSAGRVAEQGTHAELIAAQGLYHQLVQRQFDSPRGKDKDGAAAPDGTE